MTARVRWPVLWAMAFPRCPFRVVLSWVVALASLVSARAELQLAAVFSDNAVLQQGKSVPVWGWCEPGETVVMFGRSGVGKSTLANTLLGWDRQKTIEVRETDDRGRHATTSRELFSLPGGALLIDTPGLRAPGSIEADDLIPGSAEADLTSERAAEIERLAAYCRFRDCAHETEPDCAVTAAIEAGELHREETMILDRARLRRR